MSHIQQLIPALEVCRRIPAGSFTDSALMGAMSNDRFKFRIWRSDAGFYND